MQKLRLQKWSWPSSVQGLICRFWTVPIPESKLSLTPTLLMNKYGVEHFLQYYKYIDKYIFFRTIGLCIINLGFWPLFSHITELVRRGNEFRLHHAVHSPSSRLGGVRLQRNACAFSIRRNYGCVGGEAFPALAVCHDVTSRGREIRWSTLQGRVGGFWQRRPENKPGRVWGLFSFRPLCSLHQTPSASQPAQIWYGAVVGNGLSGARYVSVGLFLKKVHDPAGSSWDWGWKFCDVHRDSSFKTGLPLQFLPRCSWASLLQ